MGAMGSDHAAASTRPYRGVDAAARLAERRGKLLAAGLELLGAVQKDLSAVTVRAICQEAGVATRYFYENFSEKDEFIGAVFDWIIADLAGKTQAAVLAAPVAEQTRAGMAYIVNTISDDPRVGRLVFSTQLSDPMVIRKRAESTALFAVLSGQYAAGALHISANERLNMGAHFAVGGVGQAISAWLDGSVRLAPDELVDQPTLLVSELTSPGLYGLKGKAEVATGASPDPGASDASG